MTKATAKNEIQVVLQEYLGNRKAAKVAETVYAVMQTETESMVKKQVEEILLQNLEEDEVTECLEQLMAVSISTETENTSGIETIQVEGSDSQIYSELLNYTPTSENEKLFLRNLQNAIATGVKPFKVPVCDPSIDEKGKLQFVAGAKPAVGYTYNELEELARKNDVRLGEKKEYVHFLGTIIHRLIEEGWNEEDAFKAVCDDSTKLGHYANSANAKCGETTGSRKIAGKCDLANTYKVLANDEKTGEKVGGYYIAGGSYVHSGREVPLAHLYHRCRIFCPINFDFGVGWFVL